jgi:hypothetical protein
MTTLCSVFLALCIPNICRLLILLVFTPYYHFYSSFHCVSCLDLVNFRRDILVANKNTF